VEGSSREIIGLISADLIHINRYTQKTEPALASSWQMSQDGRTFTLHLRHGLRFSDGAPLDADDVLFTFQANLDERVHAPQRDLLLIGGRPIRVVKTDPYTLVFTLAEPDAAAERLFDSIAILPRHLLEHAYAEGKLGSVWNLNTPPSQIVGLGPFRVKEYTPGLKITLEKNPFYWKKDAAGNRLPYLDQVVSISAPNAEAEEIRFQSGDIDLISRFDPQDFSTIQEKAGSPLHVYDAGPGLEYNFLLFNLNDGVTTGDNGFPQKQKWFRESAFRRAVSAAIDRDAIVRLGYSGRARPLISQVSAGNRAWFNPSIPAPVRSPRQARDLLRTAGFSWSPNGILHDVSGRAVEFSIIYNSAKQQQARTAALVQADLKEIGMNIRIVPMDFGALVDRALTRLDYEAALMTLADTDADPNTELSVLLSGGQTHIWKLRSFGPQEAWQTQIDRLMRAQMTTLEEPKRKRVFDEVQEIMREQQPVVFLIAPDVLAGASDRVGNFRPAVLSSYTLWNADQIFIQRTHSTGAR
jgi:peptide/nickel transport system substrate-binding protein